MDPIFLDLLKNRKLQNESKNLQAFLLLIWLQQNSRKLKKYEFKNIYGDFAYSDVTTIWSRE